jgi:hypothetical protein
MGRALVVAIIIAGLAGTPVSAQGPFSVMPGQRVKVQSPAVAGEFIVRSSSSDTLVLGTMESDETYSVPAQSVTHLAVSAGPRSRRAGAGRGLGLGFLGGAVIGAMLGFADGDDKCVEGQWCIFDLSASDKAVLGGVLMGGVGAAIGGLVGAARPGERWQKVPVRRVAAGPAAGGGFAAAVSLAF